MSTEQSPKSDEQTTTIAEQLSEADREAIAELVLEDLSEDEANSASRRDVLKALGLGGAAAALGFGGTQAAVKGSTDTAAATQASGSVGTPSDPVDVYANSVDTENLNNVVHLKPGDVSNDLSELRAAIDEVYDSNNPDQSGSVVCNPSKPATDYYFADITSPVVVKEGVTLDIKGTFWDVQTSDVLFEVRRASVIHGHGAYIYGRDVPVAPFRLNADDGGFSTDAPAYILGYPRLADFGGQGFGVVLQQTTGNSIASCRIELAAKNGPKVLNINSDNGGSGGYINDNTLIFRGEWQGSTGDDLVYLQGADTVNFNNIVFDQAQTGGDPDRVIRVANGSRNLFWGWFADMGFATNNPILWESGAGPYNPVIAGYGGGPDRGDDNSGSPGNFFSDPWSSYPDKQADWVDETANRSFGTIYSATGGFEREINVEAQASADSTRVGLEIIDETTALQIDRTIITVNTNDRVSVSGTVPANNDYSVGTFGDTGSFSLARWVERD